MIEVHVVSEANRAHYHHELQQYFRARHEVFIDEKGWKLPFSHDGLEQDEFDDVSASYVLAVDRGEVIGGHRFHPTTVPHMLNTIFAYLAQWPIPEGPGVWEASRYFVKRTRRSGIADPVMMIATYQFCIEEGISQVTGILETETLARRIQAGLRLKPLGLPHDVEGTSVVAVVAEMTDDGFTAMLKKLRAKPLQMIRRGIAIGHIGETCHAR